MSRSPINLWLSVPFDLAREVLDEIDEGPDPAVLSSAPMLDLWQPIHSPLRELCLAGRCVGHPVLGVAERWIVTSQLLGLAPDMSWARTASRFYRLGQTSELRGIDSPPTIRFPKHCTPVPLDQLQHLLDALSLAIRIAEGE